MAFKKYFVTFYHITMHKGMHIIFSPKNMYKLLFWNKRLLLMAINILIILTE